MAPTVQMLLLESADTAVVQGMFTSVRSGWLMNLRTGEQVAAIPGTCRKVFDGLPIVDQVKILQTWSQKAIEQLPANLGARIRTEARALSSTPGYILDLSTTHH